jgi:rhomboid family GlyGly-CTERM serine protease
MRAVGRTLLLFALPAGVLGRAPDVFLYDRQAILHGEWWRLWTGHWVHFSASHLAWNLLVLAGAGTWLEQARPGLTVRFALATAPLISLGLLVATPALGIYGGLSGLATGVVALLALTLIKDRPAERGWWFAVLALTAAKIGADTFSHTPMFARVGSADVRVSALAHGLGALAALAFALLGFDLKRTAGAIESPATPDGPGN